MSTLPASLTNAMSQASAAALPLRVGGQVARLLASVVRAVSHRREINRMLELDDRMLKDIGLVRNDVLGALSEPFVQDPSVLLRLRSVENRARQRAFEMDVRRVMRAAGEHR